MQARLTQSDGRALRGRSAGGSRDSAGLYTFHLALPWPRLHFAHGHDALSFGLALSVAKMSLNIREATSR